MSPSEGHADYILPARLCQQHSLAGVASEQALLTLQEKVERSSQPIARLKTIRSVVYQGIPFLATMRKDWLFGQRRATPRNVPVTSSAKP